MPKDEQIPTKGDKEIEKSSEDKESASEQIEKEAEEIGDKAEWEVKKVGQSSEEIISDPEATTEEREKAKELSQEAEQAKADFDKNVKRNIAGETVREKKTSSRISRREFLKKSERIIVGAFGLDILRGLSSEGQASELGEEGERKYEEIKKRLEEQLKIFVEQKVTLTPEEILESFKNIGFTEGENIKIWKLKIENPWIPLISEGNPLKESIDSATEEGEMKLSEDELDVVQVDFDKLASLGPGAFYSPEYRAIFINQKNLDKRDYLSKKMYKEAVLDKYVELRDQIYKSDIPDIDKDRKIRELRDRLDVDLKREGTLDEIPKDLLVRYGKAIEKKAKDTRLDEAIDHIITRTNIAHEAFHDFYENQFGREGYEGPDVAEVLAVALRGRRSKFGKDDVSYAPIEFYLKEIDVNNDEELMDFCKRIVSKYDITSFPKEYSPEEWKKKNKEEMIDYLTQRDFYKFLNEYLARIYNGAMGNTPEEVKTILLQGAADIGGELPEYDLKEIYHKPSEEELELLRKMKWKGRPILKKQSNF